MALRVITDEGLVFLGQRRLFFFCGEQQGKSRHKVMCPDTDARLSDTICSRVSCFNSNRGTGGMESSVVLFNRASNCSLALIFLSQTRSIGMTAHVLDCGCLLDTSISLHPVFQTRLDSDTCELWIFVCVNASVSSLVFQTRLDFVPCLLQAFGLQLPVIKHICSRLLAVNSICLHWCFKHILWSWSLHIICI